jgi:hypothetical protein
MDLLHIYLAYKYSYWEPQRHSFLFSSALPYIQCILYILPPLNNVFQAPVSPIQSIHACHTELLCPVFVISIPSAAMLTLW